MWIYLLIDDSVFNDIDRNRLIFMNLLDWLINCILIVN